ncbi:MAG: hypothetical protein GWN62_12340, partial [Aliifodinibius sp.]|nr:hypothetical protein [Fodinibius sp.]
DLLEIFPIAHDDRYYYGKGASERDTYPEFQQERDADAYRNYLNNFWNEVILPEKGIMTIIAHPAYCGKNQILLRPVLELVKNVSSSGKYWITSLDRIAKFWNQREKLRISVREKNSKVLIKINSKNNSKLRGLTLRLPRKPVQYKMNNGSPKLVERGGNFFINIRRFG